MRGASFTFHHRFPILIAAGFVSVGMAFAQTVREVDCDKESLWNALAASALGDTLRISGTCREAVTITLDRLTLDGGGTAVFDGGVPGGEPFGPGGGAFNAMIVIDGARGVTLRGLTLRNGPGGGIICRANGAFSLQRVLILSSFFGMAVLNSCYTQIADSEISGNTDAGLGVVNSAVDFRGQVSSG
jgi:nitrous oxidase accessory protein NosD